MIALVWPIKITGLSRLQKHSKTDCWDSNSQDISWPEKKMAETDDTNNVPEGQLAALNGCSNQLRGLICPIPTQRKTLKSLKGSSPQRAKTMPPSYNLAKSGKCFTSDDSHYSWSNPACWFFRPCFVDGNHIRSISCRSLPPILMNPWTLWLLYLAIFKSVLKKWSSSAGWLVILPNLSGWWFEPYPSEKYDFVSWDYEIPNWMEK